MSERPEAMRVEDHFGVQGLSQLGRNAIDRVIELEQARARDNMAFKQLLSQRDALLEALRDLAVLREAAIRLLRELDQHGYPRACDAAVAHLRGVLMRQTGAPK